ncbi:MAG: transcription antitermination protein NusB [SAR324 cluster bacterium]|nr:transcription antitermination protein NusB [SAR324 cluster bacterium]
MKESYQQKKSRWLAFMICYQRSLIGFMPLSEEWLIEDNKLGDYGIVFLTDLLNVFDQHKEEIDIMINKNLIGWKQTRIQPLFNAVLQISVAELLYSDNSQYKVVINEAVEFAKKYLSQPTAKMGNAVLDAIRLDNP